MYSSLLMKQPRLKEWRGKPSASLLTGLSCGFCGPSNLMSRNYGTFSKLPKNILTSSWPRL